MEEKTRWVRSAEAVTSPVQMPTALVAVPAVIGAAEGGGGAGDGGEVGGQAAEEGAFGAPEVGGVGGGRGRQLASQDAVAVDDALDGGAVEEVEEAAHGGVGEDGVLEIGRTDGRPWEPGVVGGAAHAAGLGAGEADVAGDPAGVGAGGDVEVAGGVDGVGAGEGAEGADEGEAGGAGGLAGVGAAGVEEGAVGVGGGDELVGAAVGEVGGAGLLADGGVGAGGGEEFEGLVFGGDGAQRFVFGEEAEVVGDAGLEAFDRDRDLAELRRAGRGCR